MGKRKQSELFSIEKLLFISIKADISDTPTTERLDYFSATLTISFSLLYTLLRVFSLISPTSTSRLALPVIAGIFFLVISHFTYLLSFPLGSFPYGYHTAFNVCLATVHSLSWILWTISFLLPLPSFKLFNGYTIKFPYPYPPNDPIQLKNSNASTPMMLVLLTTLAMCLELFDFPPFLRILDAHSLWHLSTIPLGIAWWYFLVQDAIDLETALLNSRGVSNTGFNPDEKMPLSGGMGGYADHNGNESGDGYLSPKTPTTTQFKQFAKGIGLPSSGFHIVGNPQGMKTPGSVGSSRRSPSRGAGKEERQD